MERGQKLRELTLAPFLRFLLWLGVHANHLTALSMFSGLLFCVVFPYAHLPSFFLLGLHVILDGLDGPLARVGGHASRSGSFADTFSDQVVVAATTITMISAGIIGLIPGSVYFFAYTLVVGFAMVRNALHIPYSWLVRPRFIVYIWFVVELYLLPGTINWLLWLLNILLGWKVLTGFVRIRKKL